MYLILDRNRRIHRANVIFSKTAAVIITERKGSKSDSYRRLLKIICKETKLSNIYGLCSVVVLVHLLKTSNYLWKIVKVHSKLNLGIRKGNTCTEQVFVSWKDRNFIPKNVGSHFKFSFRPISWTTHIIHLGTSSIQETAAGREVKFFRLLPMENSFLTKLVRKSL